MGLLPYRDLLGGHAQYRNHARRRITTLAATAPTASPKRLYISRSKFDKPRAAAFLMEDLFERHFLSQGYEIVYPERLSLKRQLLLYANASHIVLAAGSAAHVAALAMNGSQHVALLTRYKDQNNQFLPQIEIMGAQFVKTFDALEAVLIPNSNDNRARVKLRSSEAVYIVNYAALWSQLSDHGFVDGPWIADDPTLIQQRIDAALEALRTTYRCDFQVAALDQISRG